MKVADVMVKDVVFTKPEAPVKEVAALMVERRISGLPVVDGSGRVVGIVSEGDLIRRPEIGTDRAKAGWMHLFIGDEARAREFVKSHGRVARDVMTQPAICVVADTPLDEVVRLMQEHRVKRVPVLQGGKLAGLVTRADLLRALVTRLAEPAVQVGDEELRKRIDAMLRKEDWAATAVVYVQVEKGVAQLWGTVDSEEQREALLLAVRGMPGVKDVQAHLGHELPG
jgi:CBS domain-containing protein